MPLRCSLALVPPPNHIGKAQSAEGIHGMTHFENTATECHCPQPRSQKARLPIPQVAKQLWGDTPPLWPCSPGRK